MINIAFLGNSHVACIKKAWDEVFKDYDDYQITFFASHADTLLNTDFKDGLIIPSTEQVRSSWEITSGGLSSVDPLAYDYILLHGLCPSMKSGSWTQLKKFFQSDMYLSVGFKRAAFKYVNKSLGHLLSLLNDVSPGKVVVTPRPITSEYDESTRMGASAYDGTLQFVSSGFKDLGVKFVSQPSITILEGTFTKECYNSNALGLGATPNGSDHFVSQHNKTHMNVEYGKEYLRDLLPALSRC